MKNISILLSCRAVRTFELIVSLFSALFLENRKYHPPGGYCCKSGRHSAGGVLLRLVEHLCQLKEHRPSSTPGLQGPESFCVGVRAVQGPAALLA